DATDIAQGTSSDVDMDGIPDDCQDCNDNGVLDSIDIANETSEDCNLDGIPDECQAPYDGAAVWIDPAGGLFRDSGNWDPTNPGSTASARLTLPDTYQIDIDRDQVTDDLVVTGGDVTLDLAGNEYLLNAQSAPGLAIGPGALTVTTSIPEPSVLQATSAAVGLDAATDGTLTVTGPDTTVTVLENLCVGCAGTGHLFIEDGAYVFSRDAVIGDLPSAIGDVTLTGAGSTWEIPFFAILDRGTVEVGAGATIVAGTDLFGGLFLFAGAKLTGEGTIDGTVVNFGEIDPGPGSTLTVNGRYFQIGQIPSLGDAAGVLRIDLDATDHDVLAVTDVATLGGGLFVQVADGYEPAPGTAFDIVQAPALDAAFDVAFFPGLDGDAFMQVVYPGSDGPAGDVTIEITTLGELFNGFDDPDSVDLPGQPTAVAVADLDGVNGPDLAITVNGPDPESPGAVLVLLNDGTGEGFVQTEQFAVGAQPTDVTAALLDADGTIDLAVSNAGDDNVSLLFNDGDGTFGPATALPLAAGARPGGIVARELTGDTAADLAVVNTGLDHVEVFASDGAGGFNSIAVLTTEDEPGPVDPSDDNPKDLGITVANRGSDSATHYMSLGGGSFSEPIHLPTGGQPIDVRRIDLDGDGLRDVVVSNEADGTVSVIRQTAPDVYAPKVDLPVGSDARGLTILDLEPDGDLDVAVIAGDGQGGSVIRILRNDSSTGQLAFADAETFDAGVAAILLASGDLDEDATEDILVINETAGDGDGASPLGPLGTVTSRLNRCVGDLNDNGIVGFDDLLVIISAWGPCPPECPQDLDGSGDVGFGDILRVVAQWGSCT
ncbi:MAG: hypothetical protein GY715_01890, partial [Planctomycetes bacterium]|nr:hypothetical protein [Planctomycetota bacterium]